MFRTVYSALLPAIGVIVRRRLTRGWQGTVWIRGGATRYKTRGAYYGAILARQY